MALRMLLLLNKQNASLVCAPVSTSVGFLVRPRCTMISEAMTSRPRELLPTKRSEGPEGHRLGAGLVKSAALYFHYPCFDGLVSGVLAWAFLENCENWRIERFCPVNYELRESWGSTQLHIPAAVVDFLYHPQASFWADHHVSTFLTRGAQEEYEWRKSRACLLFDEKAGSCASLLWDHLHSRIPDAARYQELVFWAEKIDSASYSSTHEAIWGDAPALRISFSLMLQNGIDYAQLLLKELRTGNLYRVAQLAPVSARFNEVRRRIAAGLKRVEGQVVLRDGIATFDVQAKDNEIISRYIPYHFFPEARYSIGVIRSSAGVRVTAMRNPWRNFESIALGKLFEEFGGGGHHRVGAVVIGPERADQVQQVVDRLVSEMRFHVPSERGTP
jgi:hypothetical protein